MIIDKEQNSIFIIERLNSLKTSLNKDMINIRDVSRDIKQIDEYNKKQDFNYLNDLLDPIRRKSVKIPSDKPIPSCSFQIHNSFAFNTNELGMDAFYFNPWFLASEKIYTRSAPPGSYEEAHVSMGGATYFANVYIDADGTITNPYQWYYPGGSVLQTIPDVYAKYRLVSACMLLRYTGQIDEAKGLMGGSVVFLKSNAIGVRYNLPGEGIGIRGARCGDFEQFTSFDMIRDAYFNKEVSCLEGLKLLYFPLDNSFNEFRKVCDGSDFTYQKSLNMNYTQVNASNASMKSGFGWMVYLQGVPSTSKCFRLDYYLNYECLPKAEFMNYIPISIDIVSVSPELIKKIIEEIQEKAIQSLNN